MKKLEPSVLFSGLFVLFFSKLSLAEPKQILSLTKALKKIQRPRISRILPEEINLEIAQRIIVYGEGFKRKSKVFISRQLCQNLVFLNEKQISCDYIPSIPKDNLRPEGIIVVNPLKKISKPYTSSQLFVRVKTIGRLKITPEEGDLSGGTQIYIEGTGFYPEMRVIFEESRPCLQLELISMEKLRCIAPPNLGGSQIQKVNIQYQSGAYAEAIWNYVIPESRINKIQKRRSEAKKAAQEFYSQFEPALDECKPIVWMNEIKTREVMRNHFIYGLSEKRNWRDTESIMRTKFTIQYLKAINRLEQRYPYAAHQAETTISKVYQFVENYPIIPEDRIKYLKKESALRFLDRVLTDFRDDVNFRYQFPMYSKEDPCHSNLNILQIISLVWEAIHDQEIFFTQLEQEDRQWGFIDSLANIQRAHNFESSTSAFESTNPDDPSCSSGIFKRLIEFLDGSHPDVEFYPELFSQNLNQEKIKIPNQIIALEIQQQHNSLWNHLGEGQRDQIREGYLDHSFDYEEYVKKLKTKVKSSAPKISLHQIDQIMNEFFIFSLLDI